MSKYLEAAQLVSDLLDNMIAFFHLTSVSDINLTCVEDVGLVLQVVTVPSHLGLHNLCDLDFNRFCSENELSGVTFFNKAGTVTFSMTPIKK
jgi:hypothetical protein